MNQYPQQSLEYIPMSQFDHHRSSPTLIHSNLSTSSTTSRLFESSIPTLNRCLISSNHVNHPPISQASSSTSSSSYESSKYECVLCKEEWYEPFVSKCGHVFCCHECIHKHKTCIVCTAKLTQPLQLLKDTQPAMWEELQRWKNRLLGCNSCKQNVKACDFFQHESVCEEKLVICKAVEGESDGCQRLIPRRLLVQHRKEECPKRLVICRICSQSSLTSSPTTNQVQMRIPIDQIHIHNSGACPLHIERCFEELERQRVENQILTKRVQSLENVVNAIIRSMNDVALDSINKEQKHSIMNRFNALMIDKTFDVNTSIISLHPNTSPNTIDVSSTDHPIPLTTSPNHPKTIHIDVKSQSILDHSTLSQPEPVSKQVIIPPENQFDIILMGGVYALTTTDRKVQKSCQAFRNSEMRWYALPDLNQSRGWCSAVRLGHRLFVTGGSIVGAHRLKSVECLDLSQSPLGKWQESTPLTSARDEHATVVCNGVMYVIGGVPSGTSQASTTVEWLDEEKNVWHSATPMSKGRGYMASIVYENKIYVFGGKPSLGVSHALGSAECYDPTTNQWTPLATPPTCRSAHRAIRVEDRIILLGGQVSSPDGKKVTAVDSAEIYDPITNTWSKDTIAWSKDAIECAKWKLPLPCANFAVARSRLDQNSLIIAGGWPIARSGASYRRDPKTGNWSVLPPLLFPNYECAFV